MKRMSNVISAGTARTHLGQIIRRASEHSERFLVDRRGHPAVIIMGVQDYIDTLAPTPRWLQELGAEAKRKGLNKLSMKRIDAEIAAARRERRVKAAPSAR